MNLHCIGNITYWINLAQAEEIILTVNHTFQKQTHLSQFDIITSNGSLKLSIPTKKSTRKGAYCNVEIDYTAQWQVNHWRSIENAYKKSPFFLYYGYKIEEVFMQKETSLLQFNENMLRVIGKCLHMESPISLDKNTSIFYIEIDEQEHAAYPQVFDTKWPFQPQMSILDLLFNLGPETLDYLRQTQ